MNSCVLVQKFFNNGLFLMMLGNREKFKNFGRLWNKLVGLGLKSFELLVVLMARNVTKAF